MVKTISALTKSNNLIFGLIELLNLLTLSRLPIYIAYMQYTVT